MAYEKDLYQCVMIYDFRFPSADIQLTDTVLLFHLCNSFPSMKVESICRMFGFHMPLISFMSTTDCEQQSRAVVRVVSRYTRNKFIKAKQNTSIFIGFFFRQLYITRYKFV